MKLTVTEQESEPTICLNMIVKNESKIIVRLLDSVASIIDCYCICDTGSSDNTVELITEYFEKKGVPGKIVEEEFINFAHNRNYALQGCVGMSDYILLLDADMILEIKPEFKKSILGEYDSYSILQGTDEFYYNNTRIVKNNGGYFYVGVTHEYVSTPNGNRSSNIDKCLLFIRDIGDGGAKSNKFERDIKLLKGGIEENPNSDRYHFYLANTYFDCGKYEEAIPIYKKRIEIGGWEQEVWYSYYRLGQSYKNLGKIEQAIACWLDGYNLVPRRIENLYEIIQHYRILNKCTVAHGFYKMAKESSKLAVDKDNFLFLKNDIYTYKLDYEMSILACYLGITNINDEVVKIFNNCSEGYIINNILSNMKFYKDILKPIVTLDFTDKINHTIANKERAFKTSSSCIIPNPGADGYLMNIRMVNYTITPSGYYEDCEDYIISINKCVELTKNFKIINEKLIYSKFEEKRYIGLEDVRIFKNEKNDTVELLGTTLHKNGTIGVCNGVYDNSADYIDSVEIKPSFSKTGCEKNWVFVNLENETHIIYGWHPLQICKINRATQSLDLVRKVDEMPKIFKHMRGSTNGSNFKDEIWFITHIVSYEQPRHYYHSFVVFDKTMKLLRYSAPFKFEGECIEYTIGLIVEEDRVIVPYSTWDRTAKIAIYDKKYIDSVVKYT